MFVRFVFKLDVFLWLPENECKILNAGRQSNALKQDSLSQTLLFSSAFILSLFRNNGKSSKPVKQLSEDL